MLVKDAQQPNVIIMVGSTKTSEIIIHQTSIAKLFWALIHSGINLIGKPWEKSCYTFSVRGWKAELFTVGINVMKGCKMIMSGSAGSEVAMFDGTLAFESGFSDDCKDSEGFSPCRVQ